MPDALVQRALDGDREALAELLGRCRSRIRAYAHRRLGAHLRTRLGTSDVLQSTYLDVVRSIGEFPGENQDDFARWVCHILDNNLRGAARHFGRRKRHAPDENRMPVDGVRSEVRGPVSALSVAEDVTRAFEALARLREEHRRIYVLHVLEGRSYEDCAQLTGKSATALRSLMMRARAALALELGRDDERKINEISRHTDPGLSLPPADTST